MDVLSRAWRWRAGSRMPKCGLSDAQVLWWLNKEGYWTRRHWQHPRSSVRSPLALALTHDAHWIVLADGAVLDPARETPLADYGDFGVVIEVAP